MASVLPWESEDMDAECIPLCRAMNAIEGIRTVESCCGHGVGPHRIFFKAASIGNLTSILKATHSSGWKVDVSWCNSLVPFAIFCLEGPVGPADMPGGANDLARWIIEKEFDV